MQVTIKDVSVEWVAKGKTKYGKSTVAYTFNGEQRSQNIMSFANPSVFKQVQELVGQEVDVTLTKNAAGYSEWAAISVDASAGIPDGAIKAAAPTTATRVTGSTYETAEERAKKQVYIIRQSSITAALSILEANEAEVSVATVTDIAQQLTDWVLGNPIEKAAS